MNKIQRFEDIKRMPNVVEYSYRDYISKRPIDLFPSALPPWQIEIACGKGEYCIKLAKMHPKTPILGVDIKGNRIWVGAKYCLNNSLQNVKFLRTNANYLSSLIPPHCVSDIWLTFPDPYIKKSKSSKRLTHTKFIQMYRNFLIPHGRIHLKTDSYNFYMFTLQMIKNNNATIMEEKTLPIHYSEKEYLFPFNLKTHYEKLNISKSKYIYYVSFSLTNI